MLSQIFTRRICAKVTNEIVDIEVKVATEEKYTEGPQTLRFSILFRIEKHRCPSRTALGEEHSPLDIVIIEAVHLSITLRQPQLHVSPMLTIVCGVSQRTNRPLERS